MKVEATPFKTVPFIISLLITLGVGAVASYFTIPQVKSWYLTLHKPSFNPPNWLFGPAWFLLYVMIAIAAYIIWIRRSSEPKYLNARIAYFVQLFLNFSWSIVFFGMHQVLSALIIIVLLWVSIVLTIRAFGKINKTAARLLIPYLLWVSYACMLNAAIFMLNS